MKLTALAVPLLFLAACGGSGAGGGTTTGSAANPGATQGPSRGGSINVALGAAWRSLDPAKLVSRPDRELGSEIYGTLMDFGPDGKVIPSMAESLSPVDDGKTWVMTLRPGVKFTDGTAYDAAAVKAHFDRIMDPATACPCSGDVSIIDGVAVEGDLKLRFTLKKPDSAFPSILAENVGFVASPAAVKKYGDDLATHPVGAGPFVLKDMTPGHSVTLVRNENYWRQGQPYLDSITYQVLADVQSQSSALQAGNIDLVFFKTAPGDQAALSKLKDVSSLKLTDVGSLGFRYVAFNVKNSPFTDLKARQAVALATDTSSIAKIFGDFYKPLQGIFSGSSPAHQDTVPGWPTYDLPKAKQLVQEIGGLSFDMLVWSIPGDMKLAQALQAQWKQAGINVSLTPVQFSELSNKLIGHTFAAALWGMSPGYDPDENVRQLVACKSPKNYMQYCSDEVDQLQVEGISETDWSARVDAYHQINSVLAKDVPLVSIIVSTEYFASTKELMGLQKVADGRLRLRTAWLAS